MAVITGATSGIGEATAKELGNAGMRLVLSGRRQDRLEHITASLPDAVYVVGDMADAGTPQRLLDGALRHFGRVDVLFNNAGYMTTGTVDDVDLEEIAAMIRLNFEALVRASYVFARRLKEQSAGFIINNSSIAGYKTAPTFAAYNGTKHAVEAFTDSLRTELAGTGVRVSSIAPGTVATELYDHWRARGKRGLDEGGVPLRAQDVAKAVRFILEEPAHVNVARMLLVPAHEPY